jgi:hypothetical protein
MKIKFFNFFRNLRNLDKKRSIVRAGRPNKKYGPSFYSGEARPAQEKISLGRVIGPSGPFRGLVRTSSFFLNFSTFWIIFVS